MSNRARLRAGRKVDYYPTSSEESSFGAGPYSGVITAVSAAGLADLSVNVPAAIVAEITEAGDADATYGATPEGALINETRDLANELRTRELLRFKSGVSQGVNRGQFAFAAE